jgi:hypothetical protein
MQSTRKKSSADAERERRDVEVVKLLCEERKIRLDQLAELTKYPVADLHEDVGRLEQEGFAEAVDVLERDNGFPWVIPTKAGLELAGFSTALYRTLPVLADLDHTYLAVATRIHCAAHMKGWRWTSERVSRGETGHVGHRPDGVLKRGKRTIAIEIELTVKRPHELDRIISRRAKGHTKVHYYCGAEVREAVAASIERLGVKNVFDFDLPVEPLYQPERGESNP